MEENCPNHRDRNFPGELGVPPSALSQGLRWPLGASSILPKRKIFNKRQATRHFVTVKL